ncbi:EF-hand domain-containing protein [Pararhizobium sp. DWP1-1-3]|uniref:EF-hand domain-containing protein n=1 Tax=Pararhizobium sp. DWP1-1-3 TaxID=2804652 RepID=UPI003CF14C76
MNNAFAKFDKDGDGKLNADEFKKFNEILKPGMALDDTGQPAVYYSERMDHDGDGEVSQDEMNTTGVLMPSRLTDSNFRSIWTISAAKATASA